MKLSMWIFADWLKEYHPQTQIQQTDIEIQTVRLFSQDTQIKEGTLYIGRLRDFFKGSSAQVVCAHRNDMLILDTDDMEEVLNHVLNAMEYYANWHAKMLSLLAGECMISDLLKATAPVIHAPMFILDSGQRVMAITSTLDDFDSDFKQLWNGMRENDGMSLSFLVEFNKKYSGIFKSRELGRLEVDFTPYPTFYRNIYIHDVWHGVADIIEMDQPISRGTLDLFTIFCGYVANWFELHTQQQSQLLLESLFHSALSNQECDYADFYRGLELLGWKHEDEKILIVLNTLSETYSMHMHLIRRLNAGFSNVYEIIHNDDICILCNVSQTEFSKLKTNLCDWLRQISYYGCYSNTFTDLHNLYEHFLQTKISLDLCPKMAGQLYSFRQHIMEYGFYMMKQHVHTSLVHPVVAELQEYDEKNNTEFGKTLYVYLKNERSQSKTASVLNLHRNTLTYRLHRLKELCPYDLEQPDIRLHILISYQYLLDSSALND